MPQHPRQVMPPAAAGGDNGIAETRRARVKFHAGKADFVQQTHPSRPLERIPTPVLYLAREYLSSSDLPNAPRFRNGFLCRRYWRRTICRHHGSDGPGGPGLIGHAGASGTRIAWGMRARRPAHQGGPDRVPRDLRRFRAEAVPAAESFWRSSDGRRLRWTLAVWGGGVERRAAGRGRRSWKKMCGDRLGAVRALPAGGDAILTLQRGFVATG